MFSNKLFAFGSPYRGHSRVISKIVLPALLTIGGLIAPQSAEAQFIGYTALQTTQQTLFNNTACTGSAQTAVIANLGQVSHSVLLLITAGNPTSLTMFLEGSNDGVNFSRLSDEFDGNAFGQLQSSGYFTVVRANVTCLPAGTTSFTVNYSGSGVPQNQPAGDGLRATIDKVLGTAINAGADQSGNGRTPYGNLSGLFEISTSGSFTGAASISVRCNYLGFTGPAQLFSLSGSSSTVTIVPTPCATYNWNYVHGTSTGNLGLEYVFNAGFAGPSGISGGLVANVQGVAANNGSIASVNPVLVSGKDSQTGNNSVAGVSSGTNPVNGWAIGLAGSSPGGTNTTFPNGTSPLAVLVDTQLSGGSSADSPVQATQGNCVVTTSNCNGLMTASSGYGKRATVTNQTSNLDANLWGAVGTGITDRGVLQECWFSVQVTAASGTTPTLDVFLQDGPDGSAFNDRAHLPQLTGVSSAAGGISGGGVGFTPALFQSGALAVSTKIDGPIGPYGNLHFVIGGTTPSFTFTYTVACR